MNEPKVELKAVKFHEGHEGQGVNADVYINGVKVYHIYDSGDGGCLDFHLLAYGAKNPELVKAMGKELDDYIATIPEKPLDFGNGVVKDKDGNVRMDKTTLEDYVNELLYAIQRDKDRKKMEKKMVDSILVGVPNGFSYNQIKYTRPLSELVKTHKALLIKKIMEIKVNECKNGVVILNTNLEALGLNV
jgi:hypothetical protein